jgi:hypothetical protein
MDMADDTRPIDTAQTDPDEVTPANSASENRGQRAPREGSGDVTGSGAGAGGGGGAEDFDSDPVGGGGGFPKPKKNDAPDAGADAPVHGSR